MKSRFSTIDIKATIKELQGFLGLRVVNVYDIDNKTYLIKLYKPDTKAVVLIESAVRIHSTDFDWPKNPAPSGFSMKLRKHVKGRRLEKIEQLGVDRIVDLQFGSGEAAYHVIVELYDRGNIILTDYTYTILNILRPRTDDSQDVRFAVREVYPIYTAKQHTPPSRQLLEETILAAKEGDVLKRALMVKLAFGPALIEHCLLGVGLKDVMKISPAFISSPEMDLLMTAVEEGETIFQQLSTVEPKGFIIQKSEKRAQKVEGESEELLTFTEYHPWLFRQHEHSNYRELESFSQAVDEFYSKMESQKLDMKILQQEKGAMKKLENVKKDHQKRIDELQKEQDFDIRKGELIEMNKDLVDNAILVVRSALANQIDWVEIRRIVDEAQLQGDEVARSIKDLKLDTNHITLGLRDPYEPLIEEDGSRSKVKPLKVDIDLGLGAYANSRRYFDKKKLAAKKEQKTVESSSKALKSAEKKTQQSLKDAATAATIQKARKTYWFEKFLWFISSENYLIISGRDQQQNEMIVKRYLRPGDLYVHADLHGAASVIIKNHAGGEVPPKTVNEAGTMAICHSAAWDAKVVTSAWYVYHDQVSKTAPTGEYLTTGSFMIRGKKNYLPPSYLIYGFALLFKLEEGSVSRHTGERRVRGLDDDVSVVTSELDTIGEEGEVLDEGGVESGEESDDSTQRGAGEEAIVANIDLKNESNFDTIKSGLESDKTDIAVETCDNKICETNENAINKCEVNNSEMNSYNASNRIHRTIDDIKCAINETCNTESARKTSSKDMTLKCDSPDEHDVCDKSDDSNEDDKNEDEISEDESSDDNNIDDEDAGCGVGNEAEEVEFPDTTIELQHVQGSKFSLQRGSSVSSTTSDTRVQSSASSTDDQRSSATLRISAKQRRLMKKKNRDDTDNDNHLVPETAKETKTNTKVQQIDKETTQLVAKRRQKGKQKKMKEKYGDQDEEERQLRMEILASSGAQREKKKKGKNPVKLHHQNVKKVQIKTQAVVLHDENWVVETGETVDEGDIDDGQDEDKLQDDVLILTSLTGQPDPEDELLFAVPVCAPYQSLINYKFKVKLLPGSTKRGKATKLALAMFQRDRDSSSREKDLMKILKDVDMARNIPGKVKVTAPNIQKHKR